MSIMDYFTTRKHTTYVSKIKGNVFKRNEVSVTLTRRNVSQPVEDSPR